MFLTRVNILPRYNNTFLRFQVTFRQRFLQSDAYRKLRSSKRPVYTEFGTRSFPDQSKNIFSRMLTAIVSS